LRTLAQTHVMSKRPSFLPNGDAVVY